MNVMNFKVYVASMSVAQVARLVDDLRRCGWPDPVEVSTSVVAWALDDGCDWLVRSRELGDAYQRVTAREVSHG